jgi:hypothetical protein
MSTGTGETRVGHELLRELCTAIQVGFGVPADDDATDGRRSED